MHIIEEYKRRFLQNKSLFINYFRLEDNIEFSHIIPNGDNMPAHSQMRDEVKLQVELEGRNIVRFCNELGDETFRLVSMETRLEPLRGMSINRYIYRLKYYIIKR